MSKFSNYPLIKRGTYYIYQDVVEWANKFYPDADLDKDYYRVRRAYERWARVKLKETDLLMEDFNCKRIIKKHKFKKFTKRIKLFKSKQFPKNFYGIEFERVEYNLKIDNYVWNIKLIWGKFETVLMIELSKTLKISKEREEKLMALIKDDYIDKHVKEFHDNLLSLKQYIQEDKGTSLVEL